MSEENKVYTYEEAEKACLEYFKGNELAAQVFLSKYAMRNKKGDLVEKTPRDMHLRLAKEFARIDYEKYNLSFDERFKLYFDAIDQFKRIVPQGSPMAAIGNSYSVMSASNCVVINSPDDSINGIFDRAKEFAQLFKRRCGVGTDLSTLRPEGFAVNNAAKTTSGAWSFADFYSSVGRMIGQNGRRAAIMLTMNVHHPDIIKFATMKNDLTKVTAANVSVFLTDEFLQAVVSDAEYEQRWPIDGEPKFKRMVKAKEVWSTIVNSATSMAEPGLLMLDNIHTMPTTGYERFVTHCTNPCSEVPMSEDSCRLISTNLTGYVRNPFRENCVFDFDAFVKDIELATQMSDNLVDLELELVEKIIDACDSDSEKDIWERLYASGRDGRRTGLGTHGLGDTLAQLCLKYDSDKAIEFVDKLYRVFRDTAYRTSIELAKVRGPFPEWDWEKEKNSPFLLNLNKKEYNDIKKYGRRNIAQLTQAPTGSVALQSKCGEFEVFGVSSGVEPIFRNSYTRRRKINENDENVKVDFVDKLGDKWQEFKVYHGNVANYMSMFDIESESDLPEFFVTSDQIDWNKRLEIQATEQQYIDHAISSTINLPKGTLPKVVSNIYLEAWKKGLKGVTVYVDGSRDGVLITDENDVDGRPQSIIPAHAPKRTDSVPCEIHHAQIKGVRWTIIVGLLNGDPYELFVGHSDNLSLPNSCTTGKVAKRKKGVYDLHVDVGNEELVILDLTKTFSNPESAWATRIISAALRHGTPLDFLVEQLQKDGNISDMNKVIARLLKKYIKSGHKVRSSQKCMSCGSDNLIYEEGCLRCLDCGSSKCG